MNLRQIKKVAIIGATTNKNKFGYIVLKDLIRKGFEVIPVSPKYDSIDGIEVCKDVSLLPEDTELLVFIVPPEVALLNLRKRTRKDSENSGSSLVQSLRDNRVRKGTQRMLKHRL